MVAERASRQALIQVDATDPLALACAECGWAPDACRPSAPTAALLTAVVDHWAGAHQDAGGAVRCPILRMEREDPLVVSCARCGAVTQLCTDEDMLPWKVVEHWFAVHWGRVRFDDEGRGR